MPGFLRLTFQLAITATFLWAASPVNAGDMQVQRIEYKGWRNNLKLSNGTVELVLTLDVGPRIIFYGPPGGPNVMKEYEDQLGKSGEKEWQIRGGHRLWVAPEDMKRTYALDNGPVKSEQLSSGAIRLTQSPDQPYGLQKVMEVSLAESGSQVTVLHRIQNIGNKPTELSPWALTVMAPGGTEIIPLPPKTPHPEGLLPNQVMVGWPYLDFKDPRWNFGTRFITLKQDPSRGPTKIGLAHKMGWIGYHNNGNIFVKHFSYQDGNNYPDYGCNFETFTNQDMLEVESLGPLVKLSPGQAVEHIEKWELHLGVALPADEKGLEAMCKELKLLK